MTHVWHNGQIMVSNGCQGMDIGNELVVREEDNCRYCAQGDIRIETQLIVNKYSKESGNQSQASSFHVMSIENQGIIMYTYRERILNSNSSNVTNTIHNVKTKARREQRNDNKRRSSYCAILCSNYSTVILLRFSVTRGQLS